jgi:hypothetical protein
MNELTLRRWTGIAGLIGSLLMFAGDILLFGSFVSGREIVAEKELIMGEAHSLSLLFGGFLGPVGSVFYVIGGWHIYLALRDSGKMLSFAVFFSFASGIIIGGTYHAGFAFLGYIYKARRAIGANSRTLLQELLQHTITYLRLLLVVAGSLAVIGSFILLCLVLFRKTLYPRWIIFFTPLFVLSTWPIARYVPAPVGGIIFAGYNNIGFGIYFLISSLVLWNRRELLA